MSKDGQEADEGQGKQRLEASVSTADVAFQRLPAMAHVIDSEHRLMEVSDRWLYRMGLGRHQVLGRPFETFLDEENRQRYREGIVEVLEHLESVDDLPLNMVAGDGRVLQVLLSIVPRFNARGRLVSAQAVMEDVTRLRRAEMENLEQASFIHALLESVPSPVFFKNRGGVYLGCNAAFEKFLGCSREEIVGKTVYDLAPKDLADVYYAADEELFVKGGVQIYETQVKTADSIRDVVFHKTVFGARGQPVGGLIGVVVDITARKGAEAKLKESERDKDAILSGANESILVIDPGGTIRLINEVGAARLGRTPDELAGENIYDLLPEQVARVRRARTAEILRTRKPMVQVDRRDNRYFESSVSPVVDDTGRVTRLVILARDITERVQMDEREKRHRMELSHLSRVATMGEMATLLAHELNQPLSAIHNYARGIARRLETGKGGPEQIAGAVNEIAHEATLGSEIIKRIRAHVRKAEPTRVPTDLSAVVRLAVTLARLETERYDIDLVTDLPANLPRPEADAVEIEQVVLNLLRNAVDAVADLPSGARRITVRTELREENDVRVTVADSGAGLPQDLAEKAFEPFVTTKTGGLGMGLAISRTIIEAHGGRLWIAAPELDKQGEQRGETIFRFSLPVKGGML